MKELMSLYRVTFIGNKVIGALISNVPEDHRNDKVMQLFVSTYPEYSGKVSLTKDAGEGVSVLGKPEKYYRHYDYDVDQGKYRKHSYKGHFEWKDSKGKKVTSINESANG